MKIRNILFAAILALPVAAAAGPGDSMNPTPPATTTPTTGTSAKLTDADVQVIAHLHAVDQTELALGKLAQMNGTAPVKTYGKMLMTDHTALDQKLVAFAKKKGVTTIPEDTSMTAAEKTDMDAEKGKLQQLKGAAFDQELLPMMVSAHQAEVQKLDANISNVQDGDLKSMLTTVKPQFQKHADQAQKLQSPATRSSAE